MYFVGFGDEIDALRLSLWNRRKISVLNSSQFFLTALNSSQLKVRQTDHFEQKFVVQDMEEMKELNPLIYYLRDTTNSIHVWYSNLDYLKPETYLTSDIMHFYLR